MIFGVGMPHRCLAAQEKRIVGDWDDDGMGMW
jgi:hypothetical protein